MRISEKKPSQYPLLARIIFWAQSKKYGESLVSSKLWGRSPKLLYGVQALYRAIDRGSSPIEPALRALVGVLIARINHCEFCTDIGAALLAERGISSEKLGQLDKFEMGPLFTERERAALAFAKCVTNSGERVQDQLFVRLKRQFTDDEIIELTAIISYQNLSSKFNSALDVPAQGFCDLKANQKRTIT